MSLDVHRQALHALMALCIGHAPQCDYPTGDVRGPLDALTWDMDEATFTTALRSGEHVMFDCSQSVTQLCRYAGLADPNGLRYDHAGYTGTMLAHLPHYSDPAKAQVGALVVFGPGTGEHVCMVLEPGPDPLLFSHGSPRWCGPIRLSAERQYHKPPVTLLSIAGLIPAST